MGPRYSTLQTDRPLFEKIGWFFLGFFCLDRDTHSKVSTPQPPGKRCPHLIAPPSLCPRSTTSSVDESELPCIFRLWGRHCLIRRSHIPYRITRFDVRRPAQPQLLGRERSGSYRYGSEMRAHRNAFAVLYDLGKYTDVS